MPYTVVRRFNVNGWSVDLIEATCSSPGCNASVTVEIPTDNAIYAGRPPWEEVEYENYDKKGNPIGNGKVIVSENNKWIDFCKSQRAFFESEYKCPVCARKT
jgi:hypothetical protein